MTTLNTNSEAQHDASMAKGKSSFLLGLRGLSMTIAGLGSDGDDTLVAEATDFFEQAIQGDNPELARALKGLAHQLSALVAGDSVFAAAAMANDMKMRTLTAPGPDGPDPRLLVDSRIAAQVKHHPDPPDARLLVESKIRSMVTPSVTQAVLNDECKLRTLTAPVFRRDDSMILAAQVFGG